MNVIEDVKRQNKPLTTHNRLVMQSPEMRAGPTRQMDVFLAIADPTRRALLRRLAEEGEKPVTELLKPFRMSQPAVSKHLRCLRNAGLVRARAKGRQRFYRLEPKGLRQVHTWVSFFERYWDAKLDALGDYLEKAPKMRSA